MLLYFLSGVAVVPILFLTVQYVNDYLQSSSLADSVQWESLAASNLVATKDESFIAVWEISGPDLSFTPPSMVDSLADRVERLLNTVDGETMLHVDTIRIPSTEYASADGACPPVAEFLDQERRKDYSSGEHFENRTFIALTISPASESSTSFLSSYAYTGDYNTASSFEEKVSYAQERAREFRQYIPDDLNPTRLSGSDLTSYLYLMMTGDPQKVTAPPPEYPSLRYLFAHDLHSGFEPKLGDKWYSVVGIWGYPEKVSMGVSEALYDVSFPYRFSNRLIGLNKADALAAIKDRTKKFQMQANDFWSLLADNPDEADPNDLWKDDHAQAMAFETKEVERTVQSGTSLLHHTGTVIVWDEDKDRCREKAVEVKKHLRNVGGGYVVDQEKGMATEALFGSWAGHGEPNKRRYLMLSPSATRQLPVTGTYAGPETTPCSYYESDDGTQPPPLFYASTEESVPFRYSPFGYSGDVGHQAVVGPTGTGKSIFLAFQALRQLHFEGGRSIIFDRGHSFAPLTEAVDGVYYDLDEMETGFQPFSNVDHAPERRWAVTWISEICRHQGLTVDPDRRAKISETLKDLGTRSQHRRTLRNFQELIRGLDKQVAKALNPYSGKGELGNLLNGSEDQFRDSHFITIELGTITELDPQIFTPVLTYLFHKVGTLLSPERPTHVIADEYFALAKKSKAGRDQIEQALRTYRKENAFVTIGTQSPADLTGEDLQGITNSIKSYIMLPNPKATSPAQEKHYKSIGLNDEQINLISQARKKRDYISIQPRGARKFDLGLDAELAFLENYRDLSLKETAQKILEYKSEYGSRWIYEWLRARGMEEAANAAPLDKKRSDGTHDIKFLPAPSSHREMAPTAGPQHLDGDGSDGPAVVLPETFPSEDDPDVDDDSGPQSSNDRPSRDPNPKSENDPPSGREESAGSGNSP
jgi:type IV secretory pathway VirB4 component